VALEIARSVQSRFILTRIARVLSGLETKPAYARRARNAPALRRRLTRSLTFCKTVAAVKLPNSERVILQLLVGKGPCYGLELVESSRGALKRGGVYVTLGRMEEKGYVTSHAGEMSPGQAGLPRRLYRSTPYGRELLAMMASARRRLSLRFAR